MHRQKAPEELKDQSCQGLFLGSNLLGFELPAFPVKDGLRYLVEECWLPMAISGFCDASNQLQRGGKETCEGSQEFRS